MSGTLLTSYLIQAAGAFITAVLFGFFSSTYRRPFLLHWARSWSAMTIMLVGAALATAVAESEPPASPSRLAISAIAAFAAYMQVAWLLLGSAELVAPEKSDKIQVFQPWIFGVAAVTALTSVALYATDPNPFGPRLFIRVGVRAGITGVAFTIAAVAVWWSREALRNALGRRLVGSAFILYALTQFHLFWTVVSGSSREMESTTTLYLGFTQFILVFSMGMGVVIWLLEEEHTKARDTSEKIAQLAFHDPLTGLPNRKLLLDHLSLAIAHARREKARLAVYFIDLDRFKVINDSLGHSVGDKLLQAIAARAKNLMRENDTVARMGGDEFVVLALSVRGIDDAVHIAQKVREAIAEPVQVDGRELFVTGSMGIAIYPNDGDNAEALLKNADTAMYRAKAQGNDMFQLFAPEMNAHAVEQLALENALRRAVEASEFELHYQPIVEMEGSRIISLETMLRWRHPVLGLVRPEQFIRLAEFSGMIVPIGEWTLRTASRQLGVWRSEGYPELRLAVNISGRQLKQPDFVERVRTILKEEGIPPTAIEFEITEMSATQSEAVIVERLRALHAMGIRISIDDFGTGFSSVSVLKRFPVDALKIDTRFVRDLVLDPNDAAIAAAVVALAKSMALTVIAEGVENPAQLEFLRQQECEMWQGYLCCPPVQASEVRAVLGRRSGGGMARIPTPTDIDVVKVSGDPKLKDHGAKPPLKLRS
jgi:diguanylate cyclase (GGDEF)-like protein